MPRRTAIDTAVTNPKKAATERILKTVVVWSVCHCSAAWKFSAGLTIVQPKRCVFMAFTSGYTLLQDITANESKYDRDEYDDRSRSVHCNL